MFNNIMINMYNKFNNMVNKIYNNKVSKINNLILDLFKQIYNIEYFKKRLR